MSCGRGRRNLPTQLKTTQGRETDTSQGHGRAGPSRRTVQRAPREMLSWVGAPRRAVGAPWRARGSTRGSGAAPSIASDPDRALQTSEDVRRARLTVGQLRLVEVEAASERQRHALHRLVRERAVEPRSRARAATPATQAYVGSLPDDDESRPPQLEVVVVVEEPARDEDRAATLVRADDRDERAADELRAGAGGAWIRVGLETWLGLAAMHLFVCM